MEAILSSVTDLASFQVDSEVEKWKTEGLTEPVGDARLKQKEWDLPRVRQIQKELLGKVVDQYDTARLLAAAQPESGAWIHAIPVPNLGTRKAQKSLE